MTHIPLRKVGKCLQDGAFSGETLLLQAWNASVASNRPAYFSPPGGIRSLRGLLPSKGDLRFFRSQGTAKTPLSRPATAGYSFCTTLKFEEQPDTLPAFENTMGLANSFEMFT